MAYRFKRHESVVDAVQRIIHEQAGRAADVLEDAGSSREEAIHDARKRIKKLRSLLRLLRGGGLRKGRYRRENTRLRRLAHRLAQARDAQSLIEIHDKLLDGWSEDPSRRPELNQVRERLVAQRENVAADTDLQSLASELAEELRKTPERFEAWSPANRGFDALQPGFKRNYRRARKSFHRAYKKQSDDRFHDWRKRVKDDWYHTRLLRKLWPQVMESRIGSLKSLSDLLGDDHDLGRLQRHLREQAAHFGPGGTLLACLAAQRQTELRRAAYRLGCRLYASEPSCHADATAKIWRAWKSE